MRKVAFLFMLFLGVSCTQVNGESYHTDHYTLTYEAYRNEYGNKAYTIRKTGSDSFLLDVDKEENGIYICGVKEVNNTIYLFGEIGYGTAFEKEKDAWIIMLNQQGDIIDEVIFDLGNDESILDVYDTTKSLMLKIWSIDEYARDQIQFFTEYRLYDYDFNYINATRVETYYHYSVFHNGFLFYGYHYENVVGCIDLDFNHYSVYDDLDLIENEVFYGEVFLPIINEGKLNDEDVRNGLHLTYPGNYTLDYNDKVYHFIVEASVEGVIDNNVYNSEVKPVIKEGHLLLNNQLFLSGTTIKVPGDYSLEVRGKNGYVKIIDFQITSNITGLINDQTYYDKVNVEFNGKGYLNNEPVISPLQVEEKGEYVLKIVGENNYIETYHFMIADDETAFSFVEFLKTYDIVFFVFVSGLSLFIWKRKK